MKPECWTAVLGASGRDFGKISPKPRPVVRSHLGRGRVPGRPDG